jgi:hypothetical protein
MRFIPMPNRDWEEWQAKWCFVRFDEEDDPVAYAEPTGFPKALPIWTSPARPARRPQWRGSSTFETHTSAHHVVNSNVRLNITLLQRRSCPHWEVLSWNYPTRLHQENPSDDEILVISNFLTGGNQTELLRPLRVRAVI